VTCLQMSVPVSRSVCLNVYLESGASPIAESPSQELNGNNVAATVSP